MPLSHLSPEEKVTVLENQLQDMEQFTFRAAHDLKRPLVTIESFVEILRADVETQAYDRLQEDVEEVAIAANQMRELVTELLDLARVGRLDLTRIGFGSLESRICSIGQILTSITEPVGKTASTVCFEIASNLPSVPGRETQLRELFENLIMNSLDHNEDKPDLTVQVKAEECETHWLFHVIDDGKGIPTAEFERVFQWFVQLNQVGSGSGMGLAICKRIVELHGGEIWIQESGDENGCHICFTLSKGNH